MMVMFKLEADLPHLNSYTVLDLNVSMLCNELRQTICV